MGDSDRDGDTTASDQNFGGSGSVKLATSSITPRMATGTIHDQALV